MIDPPQTPHGSGGNAEDFGRTLDDFGKDIEVPNLGGIDNHPQVGLHTLENCLKYSYIWLF